MVSRKNHLLLRELRLALFIHTKLPFPQPFRKMFRGQGNLKINFEIEPKGVTIPVSQIKYKNIAIVVVLFVVVPDLIFPDYYYFF